MVMQLSDYQSARSTNDFFTGMTMVQYGLTSRWTAGSWWRAENLRHACHLWRANIGAPAAGMAMKRAPPVFSLQRLGYGIEMIGALGSTDHFGFDWQRQQQYGGPVFSYSVSRPWTAQVESAVGLSEVSDPLVL